MKIEKYIFYKYRGFLMFDVTSGLQTLDTSSTEYMMLLWYVFMLSFQGLKIVFINFISCDYADDKFEPFVKNGNYV